MVFIQGILHSNHINMGPNSYQEMSDVGIISFFTFTVNGYELDTELTTSTRPSKTAIISQPRSQLSFLMKKSEHSLFDSDSVKNCSLLAGFEAPTLWLHD